MGNSCNGYDRKAEIDAARAPEKKAAGTATGGDQHATAASAGGAAASGGPKPEEKSPPDSKAVAKDNTGNAAPSSSSSSSSSSIIAEQKGSSAEQKNAAAAAAAAAASSSAAGTPTRAQNEDTILKILGELFTEFSISRTDVINEQDFLVLDPIMSAGTRLPTPDESKKTFEQFRITHGAKTDGILTRDEYLGYYKRHMTSLLDDELPREITALQTQLQKLKALSPADRMRVASVASGGLFPVNTAR